MDIDRWRADPGESRRLLQVSATAIALATPVEPAEEHAADEEASDGTISQSDLDTEDEEENWLWALGSRPSLNPR